MSLPKSSQYTPPDKVGEIKSDRTYMELALKEAARLLSVKYNVIDNSCLCPFHPDKRPSGSIFKDITSGDWLFKCHSCSWRTKSEKVYFYSGGDCGDAITVLREARKKTSQPMSFNDACQWLIDNNLRSATSSLGLKLPPAPPTPQPDPEQLVRAQKEMDRCANDFSSDISLQDQLWKTRAVDKDTAIRFGVCFSQGESDGDYWAFPIRDQGGNLLVVKLHGTQTAGRKSWWHPQYGKTGDPLFPVDTHGSDPIWYCPGEFKALAVISLGLPAIGITSGESNSSVSPEAWSLLRGRSVAIPVDYDATGREWGQRVAKGFADHGIEARILHVHLEAAGSDIGDWIVDRRVAQQRSAEDTVAELLEAYRQAQPAGRGGGD